MSNFLVIFVCLVAGVAFQRVPRFPRESEKAFNSLVIYLALPAVIFLQFPRVLKAENLGLEILVLSVMPWAVFLLAWFIFARLGRLRNWPRSVTGALILTAGLGNTSFVGFPVLEALLGPDAIGYGIIVDQLGSFATVSLLGIPLAAMYSGKNVSASIIAKRVYTFPPFIALLLTLVWFALGQPGLDTLKPALEKIAGTLVPLAMVAVGFQLDARLGVLRKWKFELGAGLFYKLIAAPLLFVAYFALLGSDNELVRSVTVLEAAMAPMITAAVIAQEFNLDREIANLMVAVGIPLSLLTVPLLAYWM